MFAGQFLRAIMRNKGRDYVLSLGEAKSLDNLEAEIERLGISPNSIEAEEIRYGARSAMK